MSDKEFVLSRYPDAICDDNLGYYIYVGRTHRLLGLSLHTASAAWSDAAQRIPGWREELSEVVTLRHQLAVAKEALQKASDAMNFMGDVLNGMDVALKQDVERVAPAFIAVRAALSAIGDAPRKEES